MHPSPKAFLSLALLAAAALSSATINYNNVVATVSYDGGAAENLGVVIDGNSITFVPPPTMIVSTNGGHNTAVVNISYDVFTDKPVNDIDLIFTGDTEGTGVIDFTEIVKDGLGGVIASTGDTLTGTGPFVGDYNFTFPSQEIYFVEKTFTLSLGQFQANGAPPTNSSASIGLIEQNAVPEPATLLVVGAGFCGLLSRRRRK